jgi:adenine phosphoribosyltransferase
MKKPFFFGLATLSFVTTLAARETSNHWLEKYIITAPDFPKPGLQYKCYHDLLKNPDAFHRIIKTFADRYRDANLSIIAGLETRGFIFAAALAYEMNLPFVVIRKAGGLPRKVEKIDYKSEYGKSSIEIEVDSINPKDRVLIVDDVLSTGGTAEAAATLVERLGGTVVEIACLFELTGLHSREHLKHPFYAPIAIERD